ncbi:MAG TPA: NAD(P)/FAD-dependent oxidoreductase [Solirubrobacterales bacterium]|nr:NAD(P)/FAD-dependent oxidoreductase [Solirubrobacterales bacterium]
MTKIWDCVIIGGGAAGLSAALVLGRARRDTLVIDAGEQSNLPAHGIGGLLGHDGRSPAELYEIGRREIEKYPALSFRRGRVVAAGGSVGEFELELEDGTVERSKRILLTTGMEYRIDDLPGMAELWGGSVFHCPFCHGWEVEGRPLAVRGNGERGVHGALLLSGWSEDVILLTDGPAELDDEQREKLWKAGVAVDERSIAALESERGCLTAISFGDGSRLERSGLLVAPALHQRNDLAEQLGVEPAEPNPLTADALKTDGFHRTSVPGVSAAGDAAGQMQQVAVAIATGSVAAAVMVQSLLSDEFGLPVPA